MGAGVEPGEAAAEGEHLELVVGEEGVVDRGDLQLAAGRRLHFLRDADHLVRIEIEAHDGIVALGLLRLLLDGLGIAVGVERDDAVALGIVDPAAEHGRFRIFLRIVDGLQQQIPEAGAVEDVVAQDHADGVVADELLADDKGLCQAVGRGLLRIGELHAVVGSVAQQAPEARQVVRRGDDQDLPDPRHHQHGDRVVDHRFIVDGNQLLGDALGDGIEAGSTAACEYDAFHDAMLINGLPG